MADDNTGKIILGAGIAGLAVAGGIIAYEALTAPPPSQLGTVDVTVIDKATGNPIPNAEVFIGSTYGYTNAQGVYSTQVSAGQYTLKVEASGYSPYSTTINVTAGQTTNVPVSLTPSTVSVTASANPTSGAAPLIVNFTANASGGLPPYSFLWDFGDGSPASNQQNPSHTYQSPGTYTASVTVTDSAGNTDSATVLINVTQSEGTLSVSITYSPTSPQTAPATITFAANASGGQPPYSYYWDFGDGDTATTNPATETFQNAGTYTVKVTVMDSLGNSADSSVQITVEAPQTPISVSLTASPTSGNAPLSVTFNAYASGGSGSYLYNFVYTDNMGVQESTGWQSSSVFSYTYNNAGKYSAYVEVKDSNGNTATSNTVQITVTVPTYSHTWEPEGLEAGDEVTIEVSGTGYTVPAGEVLTLDNLQGTVNWVAYKSSQGATPSPSSGSVDKSGTTSIVYTYPTTTTSTPTISSFSASPNPVTQGQQITFKWSISGGKAPYLISITDSMGLISYGVQTSNTSGTYPFTYNNAGTDTVTLQVTDANGNQASKSITVTVQAPSGTYSVTFTESGLPQYNGYQQPVTWSVTINGKTLSAQAGSPITFTGLSGTVQYSVQSPIKVVINRYGYYETYYANPSSGSVSGSKTVSITYSTTPPSTSGSSTLSGTITASPNPATVGQQVVATCTASGGSGDYYYVWGDGTIGKQQVFVFSAPGTYTLKCTIKDLITGNSTTATGSVTVN